MTLVETRVSVWEALAGRAPGQPAGPSDPGLWAAVVERLNPAKARPRLRAGIEESHLVSVRGVAYVMLRSPDRGEACYLRLTPEEVQLADKMDGTLTVARLVAEFARISGRLAPDQVTRVVADLAGNRMLEELPVDAFRPLDRIRRRPWPVRFGRGLLATVRGRRVLLANVDPLVGLLYRAGGRLLFTRVAAALCGLIALAGLALFVWTWILGQQTAFLVGGSYGTGAAVLLGLNVLALATHELGHALAAKHAGRRVPAAGFLVYFGIPSVFVDTTDVWMSGRRARIITTAAGPAAGLVMAGVAQLVGVLVPAIAPWTFKLAFAWYLNALFNLNPLLALDGYYLLMDWLELPNLRARGLAYVVGMVRRRVPRWRDLDREGRLVALYGFLAVGWLIIAVNLALRLYTDRVSGLILGLWRSGWPARVLLVTVVAGLAAPAGYVTVGWLAGRLRRLRAWLRERSRDIDEPRRAAALRGTLLGRLPDEAIHQLAAAAVWVHPRAGEQLVTAGAALQQVYAVVDGALEARRPGDPVAAVRHLVGPGGVVGLSNALTGTVPALNWRTVGTRLLAIPAGQVTAALGPQSGPAPLERDEADTLFAQTPALAGLSEDDRLGMVNQAAPQILPPGGELITSEPDKAAVIASGTLATSDGTQVGRGTMLMPSGLMPSEGPAQVVAVARSAARVWWVPVMAGLARALLPGSAQAQPEVPVGRAPGFGAHPPAGYPPLAAPPGPPPPPGADGGHGDHGDRRFERKLWWLLALVLLLGMGSTAANVLPAIPWIEVPSDRALLSVLQGPVTAVVNGEQTRLGSGDVILVSAADRVEVGTKSAATLTYRGGGTALLCAGSTVGVDAVTGVGRPVAPTGALRLDSGMLLVDTRQQSSAFTALRLFVAGAAGTVVNDGAARFKVTPTGTATVEGTVTVDGAPSAPRATTFACPDGRTPRAAPKGPSGPKQPGTGSSSPGANPSPPDASASPPDASPSAANPSTSASGTGPSSPGTGPSPANSNPSGSLSRPVQVSPANGALFTNFPRATTLTWQAVTGAAQYLVEVQCDVCGSTPWVPWGGTTTSATSYEFTWVGDNQGRWRITAIAPDGTPGTASDWWYFTYRTTASPPPPPPPLCAPVLVSPKSGTLFFHFPRTTTLTWQACAGAAQYQVEVQCDVCGSTPWVPWGGTTTSATSYGFTWVGDNQGRWRVTAIAPNGTRGPASAWWYFRYDTRIAGFAGTWANVDPSTRSIPQITVAPTSPTTATLHVWGACTPTWCDWGTTTATLSASGVLNASYNQGFAFRTIRISRSGTQLVVQIHTHFTDNSGRADYDSTDTMYKR